MTDTAPTNPTFVARTKSFLRGIVQLVLGVVAALVALAVVLSFTHSVPTGAFFAALPGLALAWWLIIWNKGFLPRAFAAIAIVFSIGCVSAGVLYFDGTLAAKEEAERTERARIEGVEKAKAAAAKAEEEKREQAEAAERKLKAEADAAEKAKRDALELVALRKTNPDEYLRRLKDTDLTRWKSELAALRPKEFAAYQESVRREQEAAEIQRQRKAPTDYLTVNFNWSKSGFGSVMVADFTIKSTLLFPVQDVTLLCTTSGNSGTKLSILTKTLFEVVPAKGTKRVADVNMGFMDSQSSSANCSIVSVKAN